MAKPAPAAKPAAKPAAPKQGGTTGANLMQQYEAAINRGVGQGTGGNPLGDFKAGAEALWDSSANLRQYGDRLRGESRAHERTMQGDQIKGQQAVAGIQAGAQTKSAGIQAGAQKSVAQTGANASRFEAQVGADTEKYLGRLNLEGTKYQTKGRIEEAGIGAKAQVDVAGLQTRAQKYVADIGLQSDLASFGSNERIAGMSQAGENYRSGLQLAGSLLMNKDDNYTQRQGKFFDYMGNVAQSQWRAPDVNNIKYWG